MDKGEVVRCLRLANQLWAIEGASPYSVKAHERAAQAILHSPLSISDVLQLAPGQIPGVGRETLAMLQALVTDGMPGLLRRLNITISTHCAELLRLPGVGPKTAHSLIHQHQIESLEDLHDALLTGRLTHIPGFGPSRFARLRRDLRVLMERKQAIPIALGWAVSKSLAGIVQQLAGVESVYISGPIRRLLTMSNAVELVVVTDDVDAVLKWASQFQRTEVQPAYLDSNRVTLPFTLSDDAGDIHVLVHVVNAERYPLVLMRTTGDETHQAVIKGLLNQQGIEWTSEDRLICTTDMESPRAKSEPSQPQHAAAQSSIEVHSEADIYALVGLPLLPPEIREEEGLLCNVNGLIRREDIRGDLHVHTTWSDGSLSIEDVVQHAERLGYEYIAITDHSQSLTIAGGLTPDMLREQRAAIDKVRRETKVKILHGIEVDILASGDLDLPQDVLFELDIVIASVHSSMQQPKDVMTERLLRAIRHPAVHIIGHLTGRILGRRAAYEVDSSRLLEAALQAGVTFELNANPNRLDISENLLRKAKELGFRIPINTDTHHEQEFSYMDYGVRMAQRGWLERNHVLNALSYKELVQRLHKPHMGGT